MAQNSTHTDSVFWEPVPTTIPPEWQTSLETLAYKTKVVAHYMPGMRFDGPGTLNMLRKWGLPTTVAMAGALLFSEEKDFCNFTGEHTQQIISHIRQARRYIDCIEDDDLSALLSSHYSDLGALLIAVATCYVSLQRLLQSKNKHLHNQRELSRIESIGSTLLHITKHLNLWLFKRDVEDLILQLCDPIQYGNLKEEHQQLIQRDAVMLNDLCREAEVFCKKIMQKPIHIRYSISGICGFARRRQYAHTTLTAQKTQLTGFDLAIFNVIVPTFMDCYHAFGALSQLGYGQDRMTEQIAHPKPNGSSYLSFGLILEQEPYLQALSWISQSDYVCQLQIATQIMHAVTNYGCLYPTCYQLYTNVPAQVSESPPPEKLWVSQDGKIFTNIIQFFQAKQALKDPGSPVIVYDKKRRPVSLPKGATVLDFAYACNENLTGYVYGFINDREVPLERKLHAGDIVDIRTSNTPQAHEYWIERKYVTTSRALDAIQKQRFYEHKGYKLLWQKLEYYRFKLNEDELSQELHDFVKKHYLGSVDTYLKQLDESADLRYTSDWAAQQIMQQIKERNEQVVSSKPNWVVRLDSRFASTPIYFLPKRSCNVCQPAYPRDINVVGYVSRAGKTLVIHSTHCPRLLDNNQKQRGPLYSLTWHQLPAFNIGFFVTAQDRRGLLFDITKQLRNHQCMLVSIYAEAVYKDAQIRFIIETYDTGEVLAILQKIKKVKSVINVDIDPSKTAPKVYEQLQTLLGQTPFLAEKLEAAPPWEDTLATLGSRRPVLYNPFDISHSPEKKMFFGRTSEIKILQGELCNDERGGAVFLHGPRRSGKSSLCKNFLEHHISPSFWYVHYSLQGATRQNEATILMHLADEICWAFQERFDQQPLTWQNYTSVDPQMRFKRVLQGCLASIPGSRLILALDEFGGTVEAYQSQFLEERFFTYWRNLMLEIPQLSLIFILPTIPHSFLTSGQLSNAFSFTISIPMGFLDETSAKQLLVEPLREQNIAIHPNAVSRALSLTGHNPYYLTLVGHRLIYQLTWGDPRKNFLNDDDLAAAVDYLTKGDTKYNFYFHHDELFPDEIPLLEAIVNLTQQSGQPTASLKKIAECLHEPVEAIWPKLKRLRQGLILREQDAEWFPSEPYYSFTIELVRLWLAQNAEFFLQ